MAKILDVKPFADKMLKRLKRERKFFGKISLASIKAGRDSSRDVYIASQIRLAEELDIDYQLFEFGKGDDTRVLELIKSLNKNKLVKGVIIHKPLPGRWDEFGLLNNLAPSKDIEGITPYNLGRIFLKNPGFLPPTVLSVLEVLKIVDICIYGKNVTLIGFSSHIGKPLSIILTDRFATVSLTHIATYEKQYLPFFLRSADIIISCVGKPQFIRGTWIKKGALIIDVGISRYKGRLCGDVNFKEVEKKASFITPVPGGVGVFTALFLFSNLLKSAKQG
ncbi:MAG: bifunctional 5,10-methylenetetrahydrofolate dehydrogenase/5,10-methenyltetrahydrofolate cyclohydrolase [Candidatus Omnitrophica bacterium]|nr:bifunctional 5,10-methylenetetrahydrofolate dehydrogenase/5,10-methenyltetrahydrofolate cyclohydrolase [Candidatus Omnitrophota bacterium]